MQIIQSILDDVDGRIEDCSESKKLRTDKGNENSNIPTFTLEDEDAKIKKVVFKRNTKFKYLYFRMFCSQALNKLLILNLE